MCNCNASPYSDWSLANRCQPYGSRTPLVDRVIGPDAFDVVWYVAQHMTAIQRAASIARNQWRLETTLSAAVSPSAFIVMPQHVLIQNVVASNVMLQTLAGELLSADSGLFKTKITNDGLTVTIDPADASIVDGATVRWFLTFEARTHAPVA